MHYLRQNSGTGAGSGPTVNIGPALDANGAEYTGLVIGDLTLIKNGTSAAMAANATLTHTSNGHYDLVMIGNNADTVGRLRVRCNKSGYQIPPLEFMVIEEAVYDALFASGAAGYNATTPPTAAEISAALLTDLPAQLVGTRITLGQQVFVRGQPLRIVQGDSGDVDHDTEIRFHWDNPPDLSGATVNFYGQHRDDATDLFSWDADFETISATREDIVVEWDDDMSEALTSGQYDCRLVVEFADGQQYHLVIGQEGSDRYIFPLDVLPAWEGSP